MRTSREVYDRIRHDPRFDPSDFVIGYEARLPEPKEIPFTAFVPGGDLPWHRVLYFREGNTVLWDRRTRIDEVFGAGARAREARKPSVLLASDFFTPLPLHRFDETRSEWIEALPDAPPPGARPPPRRLRVATWNVLSDEHHRERVATARRAPAIVEALERLDADVIALQEVSPLVFTALLSAPWVRRDCTLSEGPRSPALRAEGALFLFRVPVEQLAVHAFSRAKRAVAAVLRAGEGSLVVAQIHLPSDFTAGADRSRPAYLGDLLTALGPPGDAAPPSLVLGDFNWDDPSLDTLLGAHGFTDAWPAAGQAPVPTFDPTKNALAAIMTRTGRPIRIDRVYARGGMQSVHIGAAALFATDAIARGPAPLFPSDHFGVTVTLDLHPPGDAPAAAPAAPGATTHHTAVVLVPPAELWPAIQAIRGPHDRHATRWMPHITLLYPFVPEVDLDRARHVLGEVLAGVAPSITFRPAPSHADTVADQSPSALHACSLVRQPSAQRCPVQQAQRPVSTRTHAWPSSSAQPLAPLLLSKVDPPDGKPASSSARPRSSSAGESPFEVRCSIPSAPPPRGTDCPASTRRRFPRGTDSPA
ncbi:MAG: RNA repair domain-containing protein [Polyangiaceae bacterium]